MTTTTAAKISTGKEKMNAALDKSRKMPQAVANSANVLKASNGSLRPIPGYGDYVVNLDVTQVISKKTGKVQQIPAGKKKYLIFNDKGERRSIGIDDIKLLMPKNQPKVKASSTKTEGGPSKREQILALHAKGKTAKEIETETGFKYNTVYECIYKHTILSMHAAGKTPTQIHKDTGYSMGTITRQIDKYGKKK